MYTDNEKKLYNEANSFSSTPGIINEAIYTAKWI